MTSDAQRLSIIVLARQGSTGLAETLRSLGVAAGSTCEAVVCASQPILDEFRKSHGDTQFSVPVIWIACPQAEGAGSMLDRAVSHSQGEIIGFLTPGETLAPETREKVMQFLASGASCDAVAGMASARFAEPGAVAFPLGPGVAEPFEHLAVWRRGWSASSRASVFWRRAAWHALGGIEGAELAEVEYEFICRLITRARVRRVEDVLSVTLLPTSHPGDAFSDTERLGRLIDVSRRYWGAWATPIRWGCEWSWRRYRRQSEELIRHHARRCEAAIESGMTMQATAAFLHVALGSPGVAAHRLGPRYLDALLGGRWPPSAG